MMHRHALVSLFVVGGMLLTGCQSNNADEEEWLELFNGRDLDGWTPKIRYHAVGENFANTFRVEDGLFTVSYDGYDTFSEQFGHIFYKEPYSHYRLRVEYRFIGEPLADTPGWAYRNSGAMVHSQDPATMPPDQDFPISIEVQFLGGLSDGKSRPTGNMCSPGTHIEYEGAFNDTHCINSTSPTFDGDQWVLSETLVLGSEKFVHYINGQAVIEYANTTLWWRRCLRASTGDEAGRRTLKRRLHLVAKRRSRASVPARGTIESERLHGCGSEELQKLFCS